MSSDFKYVKVEKGIATRGSRYYVAAQNGQQRVREVALLPDGDPCRTIVQARAALAILKGRVRDGRHVPADKRNITISDILKTLEAHWRTANDGGPITTFDKAMSQVEILRKEFGTKKAMAWRYQDGAAYLATGQTQAQRGTLSARLSILRNAFRVAKRNGEIHTVPAFPERVDNVRQGYIEPEDFDEYLTDFDGVEAQVLDFDYLVGQRISRVLGVHVTDVDPVNWMIRGEPSRGNKQRPMVPLVGRARLIVEDRLKAAVGPHWLLFHRDGQRISHHALYDRWKAAMKRRGLTWTLHDFRRSAARNLVNAGVDPSVAMKITGHSTVTMFTRYAINPTEAVMKAAQQLDTYLANKRRRASSVESVTGSAQ